MTIVGQDETGPAVDSSQVRLALQHVLASQTFRQSARMSCFLSHVVEATLAEEKSRLKEVCIGVAVFGRPADYSPKVDPVVRNEARRLRGKLEQYYATEGTADILRITIPRGAYVAKFEAPEGAVSDCSVDVKAETETEEPRPLERARTPVFGRKLMMAAVMMLLGALTWANLKRPKVDRFAGARFSYLTSLPTREVHPSISPDGLRVIYSSDQDGHYNIYVATLDGQTTRLTRGEANEIRPAWSPDGQLFAFLRVAEDAFDVIVSPVAGGAERKVARIEQMKFGTPRDDVLLTQGSPGPAWSPSGAQLVFTSGVANTSNGPLHVLQLNSGQERQLTHPPKGAYDFYPAYSPDGKRLAFCRLQSNSTSSIYLVPAGGGQETQVTDENRDIRGLAWMPDSRSIIISSNRAGPQRLWRVDIPGGEASPFPTAGASARDPSVSRDGRLVVYGDYMLQSEIWGLSVKNGREHSLSPSTRQDHSAQYSPDGNNIAFISDRSGCWELWTMLADGGSPRQLTHFDGPLLGSAHWSPDGKYLAFDARPRGHSSIFVIAALGGAPRVLDDGLHEDKMPSWSYDGKWIYFNSDRGGSQQLWRIAAAGGQATLLSKEFAMDSLESPDGRTVYFLGTGPTVWQVPAGGGVAKTVNAISEAGFLSRRRMISVTTEGIWFLGKNRGSYSIWLYDFASGHAKPKVPLQQDAMLDIPGLSVAPDGSTVLYARRKESRSDLMLVRGLQ